MARDLGGHAAGPGAPGARCARLVSDDTVPPDAACTDRIDLGLVGTLFRARTERASTFAVRPLGPVGTRDEASVRSDDVAITLR